MPILLHSRLPGGVCSVGDTPCLAPVVSGLATERELVLELPHLKQLHPALVRAQQQSVLGDPGHAQVVGRLHLHEGKLLEVALGIAVELEQLLPCNGDLGVVLRVEGNLQKREVATLEFTEILNR